jgi:hypothetical protein
VVDAPILVAAASMKAARCPHCGGSKLGMGGELDGKPDLTAPIALRVAWWQESGEQGRSSKTIFGVFTGQQPKDLGVPLDPDDFRRCKLFLDLIPEWRADLGKMKTALPWWGPLVDKGEELERLFAAEESLGWKPPRVMYKFMRPLVNDCDAMQYDWVRRTK